MSRTAVPPCFHEAGLTAAILREIDCLVVGVGGLVREILSFTSCDSTVKDASGQRVTVADTLADRLLRESLLALVPASSGFSEEAGHFGVVGDGLRVSWLVDPLDGTRSATVGGVYAISVAALVLDGQTPIGAIGWIYVPPMAVLYRGVLSAGYHDCRSNGAKVESERVDPAQLALRYAAVGSDWGTRRPLDLPMKLYAPGATAVHLTLLVQPGSDVAAALLSRYKPYDAAAGIVIAAAGGCALYAVGEPAQPFCEIDPLGYLLEGSECPNDYAPLMLVCRPEVADALQ